MTTFFTADLHLGHERIIELCGRPFESVREMNSTIIDNWNTVVLEDDDVFVLGDVALGKISESLPLVKHLNGRKFLVPGNHDRCWSGNKKVREIDILRYEDEFIILPQDTIHKSGYRLNHFPYAGDSHDEDRYKEFRPVQRNDDEILLHGHVHNAWKTNGNQINVGVDVWGFFPVSLAQLLSGPLKPPKH